MKIKDLLRTRALNLMKLSYVGGLKFQWHKSVMFKNLWKASGYMNKARLIKSPFRKLKAYWVL